MSSIHRLRSLLLCAVASTVIACLGTEVGNPQDSDTAEVFLDFQGVERTPRAALTLENGVEFTEIWIVFEKVEFKSGDDCDQAAASNFDSINVVEFVSGQQFPGYDFSSLPAGEYCEVEVRIESFEHVDLPPGVPEELNELAILIRGRRADGTPFVVSSESSEGLVLDGRFELNPGREALFLAFALNEWFSPEQLAAASGEEVILIDDGHNTAILDDFLLRLESTALLIRDENQDGVVQAEELASPLAAGESSSF